MTGLPQERWKIKANNLTLFLKELEKEQLTKPKWVEGNDKDHRKNKQNRL